MEGRKEVKKFDKKAYRTKKYDNKAKLEEWKQKRKVSMQHKYKKLLKKEPTGHRALDIYKQFENTEPFCQQHNHNQTKPETLASTSNTLTVVGLSNEFKNGLTVFGCVLRVLSGRG